MKARILIVLLYIASFFASIGPALTFFLIHQEKYIKTVPDKVKISAGIVIITVIVVIKLMGKLKINSRIFVFGVVFLLSYLFEALLNDLLIFSFLALIGEIADILIMMLIKKIKTDLLIQKSANANADAMEEAFNRLSGRV